MDWLIDWLRTAPPWQTVPAALAENFLLHGIALALGDWVARRFPQRRVAPPAAPMSRTEVIVAVVTLLTNSATTIAGLYLWRMGFLRVTTENNLRIFLDVPLLLLIMDGAMYVLHRVAHLRWVYPWLHRLHHEYDRPRPLTLFILNPVENVAFGGLMLGVLCAYPFHVVAVGIFIVFNIVSGIVGHLGVEPLPDWWARTRVVRNVTGGTFHAGHHLDLHCNFGFYTLIWDRLLGTLRSDYWTRFGKLPTEVACRQGETP